MAGRSRAAVAASSQWVAPDGVRQPGGDVHAWLPGTNQTLCGLPLARAGLGRFPHTPFDFRASDTAGPHDEVRHICRRCLAATGARRDARCWRRVRPRP